MSDRINYAHNNIGPFVFVLMLACAAQINHYTSYLFLLSFLAWATITITWAISYIYRVGVFRWLWDNVTYYAKLFWNAVVELAEFYLIKVFIGLLTLYGLVTTGYWLYHHFDLPAMLKATWDFIINIPVYLLDVDLLIAAIHRWLNKVVLKHIVAIMSSIWKETKYTVLVSPISGLAIIFATITSIILLFAVGSWVKPWLAAIYSDLMGNKKPQPRRTTLDK